MKDIYIPKKVPRIEVREKLHGHTQILLRSERTGKVERIEHDNMFTGALEEYIRSTGWFGLDIFNQYSTTNGYMSDIPAVSFFGGILLFETNIPTDSFLPPAVNMTANARYGSSNSGEVTELGSFNAVESSFGNNALTFVYDWGTSQGNGNIGSVCIVPNEFGYIGLGNGNSKVGYNWDWKSYNQNSRNQYPVSNVYRQCFFDNFVYYVTSSSISNVSSITIYKKKYLITEFDPFVGIFNNTSDAEAITIPFGTTISGNHYIKTIPNMDGCYLVAPSGYWENNTTATFYIVDAVNQTATPYTITNTTGRQINGNGYGLSDSVIIDDTYMMIAASSYSGTSYAYYFYKMNYKTDTLIGLADGCPSLCTSGWYSFTGVGQPCFITPKHLLYARPTGSSGATYSFIYDTENNRVLPTNASMGNSYNTNQVVHRYIKGMPLLTQSNGVSGSSDDVSTVRFNPFRLMTINNLDFPVTKTADKTMKVTYTITRA